MALTTLARAKRALGIATSDTAQDDLLADLILSASAHINKWCRRTFERTTYTEYPRCYGTRKVRFRQRPVLTLTSVYLDSTRTFAAGSLLTVDEDYALINQQLVRLSGVWPMAVENRRGLLANKQVPAEGIVKVVYVAGYDPPGETPGTPASPMPEDVIQACNLLIARDLGIAGAGESMQAENLEDYSYLRQRGGAERDEQGIPPEITGILAPYRRLSLGGA